MALLVVAIVFLQFGFINNKPDYYTLIDEGKEEGFGIDNILRPEIRIYDSMEDAKLSIYVVLTLLVLAVLGLFCICCYNRRVLLPCLARHGDKTRVIDIRSLQTALDKTPETGAASQHLVTLSRVLTQIMTEMEAQKHKGRKTTTKEKPKRVVKEEMHTIVDKELPPMLSQLLLISEVAVQTQKRIQNVS